MQLKLISICDLTCTGIIIFILLKMCTHQSFAVKENLYCSRYIRFIFQLSWSLSSTAVPPFPTWSGRWSGGADAAAKLSAAAVPPPTTAFTWASCRPTTRQSPSSIQPTVRNSHHMEPPVTATTRGQLPQPPQEARCNSHQMSPLVLEKSCHKLSSRQDWQNNAGLENKKMAAVGSKQLLIS